MHTAHAIRPHVPLELTRCFLVWNLASIRTRVSMPRQRVLLTSSSALQGHTRPTSVRRIAPRLHLVTTQWGCSRLPNLHVSQASFNPFRARIPVRRQSQGTILNQRDPPNRPHALLEHTRISPARPHVLRLNRATTLPLPVLPLRFRALQEHSPIAQASRSAQKPNPATTST